MELDASVIVRIHLLVIKLDKYIRIFIDKSTAELIMMINDDIFL